MIRKIGTIANLDQQNVEVVTESLVKHASWIMETTKGVGYIHRKMGRELCDSKCAK